VIAKATLPAPREEKMASMQAVVLPYKRATPARATLRMPRTRHVVAAAR
jgi:hypothetical protein